MLKQVLRVSTVLFFVAASSVVAQPQATPSAPTLAPAAQLPSQPVAQAPAPVVAPIPIPVPVTIDGSQAFWVTTMPSILGFLGIVFGGLMTYFMAKLKIKGDETLKIVNTVHTLVNSDMHVALQTSATLARKLSDVTKTPADIAAADKAEKAVIDHDMGQAKLDAEKAAANAKPG